MISLTILNSSWDLSLFCFCFANILDAQIVRLSLRWDGLHKMSFTPVQMIKQYGNGT